MCNAGCRNPRNDQRRSNISKTHTQKAKSKYVKQSQITDISERTRIDDGRDGGGDGDGDGGGDEDEDDDGADHDGNDDGNDDGDEARGEREPSGGSDNFILFYVPSDRIRGRLNPQYPFPAM